MHKEKETWELDCGISPSEEKALKRAATDTSINGDATGKRAATDGSLNGDATGNNAPVSNPDREPEP